jgi:hypothetical protein
MADHHSTCGGNWIELLLECDLAGKGCITRGNFIEIPRTQFFPLSTTLANAEAQLQNDFNAQQSALAASVQPGQFYGNFFDTGWTQ